MKYGKQNTNKLIAEMMPMLNKAMQIRVGTKKGEMFGWQLIAEGTLKTATGKPIVRGELYPVNIPIMGFAYHPKAIKKIISKAKTEAEFMEKLTDYLVENAISLEAIKS